MGKEQAGNVSAAVMRGRWLKGKTRLGNDTKINFFMNFFMSVFTCTLTIGPDIYTHPCYISTSNILLDWK